MPIVNYVREHVRFIEYATDEMLSASERLLWYGLMDVMNHRAQGNIWPEEFIRIDNITLCRKAGIKFDALADARNKLKQRGLIDYIPGERNKKNPMYKMTYFFAQYAKPETEDDVNEAGDSRRIPVNWEPDDDADESGAYPLKPDNEAGKNGDYPVKPDNMAGKNGVNPVKPDYYPYNSPHNYPYNNPYNRAGNRPNIYYKHKEKEYTETHFNDDEEDEEEDNLPRGRETEKDDPVPNRPERMARLANGFKSAFGRNATNGEINRILTYCYQTGMPDMMAFQAMQYAAAHGARDGAGYAITILDDWRANHVFQPQQIASYQIERDRMAGRNGLYGSGDAAEDYREQERARNERLQENREAGLEA